MKSVSTKQVQKSLCFARNNLSDLSLNVNNIQNVIKNKQQGTKKQCLLLDDKKLKKIVEVPSLLMDQ